MSTLSEFSEAPQKIKKKKKSVVSDFSFGSWMGKKSWSLMLMTFTMVFSLPNTAPLPHPLEGANLSLQGRPYDLVRA